MWSKRSIAEFLGKNIVVVVMAGIITAYLVRRLGFNEPHPKSSETAMRFENSGAVTNQTNIMVQHADQFNTGQSSGLSGNSLPMERQQELTARMIEQVIDVGRVQLSSVLDDAPIECEGAMTALTSEQAKIRIQRSRSNQNKLIDSTAKITMNTVETVLLQRNIALKEFSKTHWLKPQAVVYAHFVSSCESAKHQVAAIADACLNRLDREMTTAQGVP